MIWTIIDTALDLAERLIPRRFGYSFNLYAGRVFGLTVGALLGIPLWTQTCNGWTFEGKREPLRYRLSVACLIWRSRYWYDRKYVPE